MRLLLQCALWLIAGGVVVLAETFSHEIYRKSLARLFELDENGYLQMYFNATFDVIMSKVRLASQPQWIGLCALVALHLLSSCSRLSCSGHGFDAC